jgi:hypothetical protein
MNEAKNRSILEFCKNFAIWIKNESIAQSNVYFNKKNSYNSGKSMVYYRIYYVLQQQAQAFLIPLEVLGFDDVHEKDFLSMEKIILPKSKCMDKFPLEYRESIIYWMKDNMWVIDTEIDDIYNKGKLDKFDQGQLDAYEDILDYMEKKAEELGFNLLELSPRAVKEIRKKRRNKNIF